MKKQTITLTLFLVVNLLQAQNPLVKQWDRRYGGNGNDQLFSFKQTFDGGYIFGGRSNSDSSGDKTQPWWGNWDYWIVKIDSVGSKQWDKRFGGTGGDELYSLQQTSDSGYILGGYSSSGVTGDKTQPNWGSYDYWIVKIDSAGNKQWDKRFGGTALEIMYSLQQTSDGGYILGGYSYSDSSGDKTEPNWDAGDTTADFWIVKIDSIGNKQWDKRYGGTGHEQLYSLQQTTDGGYILGGYSTSDSSGDKTQPNWDWTLQSWDFWIVKTDSLGNKQWDKRFGGASWDEVNSLQQTSDGGFILGGYAYSNLSGDKTHPCHGWSDYWIVKTDSLGNKEWDNDFGGSSWDDFVYVTQTPDDGYIVGGTSYSPASGNKTENNLGAEQNWIIKTDSLGNKMWDKTILTTGHDEGGFAIPANYGCYTIASYSNGGVGGDKTQPAWLGSYDYWIIKYCDSTLTTEININSNPLSLISIYPNPFSNEISVTIQKQSLKQITFKVKNILGQTVFSKQENNLGNSYTKTIELNELAKGIYLLDIFVDGERTVKKIVKE